MKILAILFSFYFISICSLCFADARQGLWRCGNEVIKIGDTKSEVLLKCGPPTLNFEDSIETRGSYRKKFSLDERDGTYYEKSQIVEEWTYNCGTARFIYILTFTGGRLNDIRSVGYGSGESDCDGAGNRYNDSPAKQNPSP
ncbi:DUF2845 domain-containing protein [Thermodesulfobacteriota bacterium]